MYVTVVRFKLRCPVYHIVIISQHLERFKKFYTWSMDRTVETWKKTYMLFVDNLDECDNGISMC